MADLDLGVVTSGLDSSTVGSIGLSMIVILVLVFIVIIGGILFLWRGGWDRWKKKVPILARATDKVDIWEGETRGVGDGLTLKDFFPHTYDAITWMAHGSLLCYIPSLKNMPFILPAKSLNQKVMQFVRLGADFIRVDGIQLQASELVTEIVKDGEGEHAVSHEVIRPTSYIINVYIPEIRRIMEDVEVELTTHAEIIRPRQNPLNQLVGYAILGLLVFAMLFTVWFSYSQSDKALGLAPSIVKEGMAGATRAVIEILANQTAGGRVL